MTTQRIWEPTTIVSTTSAISAFPKKGYKRIMVYQEYYTFNKRGLSVWMRKSVYSRYRSYKAPPYSYYLRKRHDLEYTMIALEMILRVLTTERRVGYSYCKMLQSMKTTQTKARISPGAYISTAHRSLFDRWAVLRLFILIHQSMFRSTLHILIQITAKHQLCIFQGLIIDQPVQF